MPDCSTEHRKLAAIMFTDMVGYSALSQRNEVLALELLQEHRQLLRSVFPKYQGNEIKSTGDGFLVEFASALAAVQCAVEIQKMMRERNEQRSAERRVLIRIGIHLGDVVRRENDVFGDGVNIAARIEPLAEPGGICVSRAVYEQIENKVEHALVQLSKPALKNIQATVEVYRLLLDETRVKRPVIKSARAPVVITGMVVVLGVIGVIAFLKFGSRSVPSSPETKAVSSDVFRAAVTNSPALLPVELRVLHSFGPTNAEGVNPWGVVTLASDGLLYGCTVNAGPAGGGSLYRLRTNGSDYAVLRNFDPVKDGYGPQGVIEGSDGRFYGVTFKGGTEEGGVIFRVAKDGGDFRVLHHFASVGDLRNPQSTLLEARDGSLYGTALSGKGAGLGAGGVYRIAKDGSGYAIVTGFGNGQPDHPRGAMAGLIQGTDGAFYGATRFGGVKDNGSVFRLDSAGKLSVVKSFGLNTNGITQPVAALLQAGDRMLYGTCSLGGLAGGGAIFRMSTNGNVFQPHTFAVNEARELSASLIEAPDGSLLGTSLSGGAANLGVIFQVGKDGHGYRSLHDFRSGNADGARARSPLTAGAAGIFYGATAAGGTHRGGVVFQLSIPELAQPPANTARPSGHSPTR